jgi:hypothetical protein
MVTTTFTNGTTADATEVNQNFLDVENSVWEDQTGGSVGATDAGASEAMIGEVALSADDVLAGVLVIATGSFTTSDAVGSSGTAKLYSGENAAFGSNTLRKTITRSQAFSGETNAGMKGGWTLIQFISAETWSNPIYIQITGTTSWSGGNGSSALACESLVVIKGVAG